MKKTILLVEPNHWSRKMIINGLKGYGYHFIECEDGQTAQDVILESHKRISLVISELSLPKLSGYDLIKKIKQQTDIPVIIQSSSSQKALILECMKIGVRDFFKKPTSLVSLKDKIFEILGTNHFQINSHPRLKPDAILTVMKSMLYEKYS